MQHAEIEEARDALRRGLSETPEVDPLDALRDAAELVALLAGWQWQTMHAARVDGAGWAEIDAAVGTDEERTRRAFGQALDRQEVIRTGHVVLPSGALTAIGQRRGAPFESRKTQTRG